jgi:tetratricopeptide (TPR) repeat protein
LLKQKADSLYEAKNYEMALGAFHDLLAKDSSSAEAFKRRGNCYSSAGMLVQAARDFKKAIEIDSTFSDAYFNLGSNFFRRDQYRSSLVYYKKYHQLEPTDYQGVINIAGSFYYLGEADSFQLYLQRSEAMEKDTSDIHDLNYAVANYCNFRINDKAEKYAQKGIKLFPDEESFYFMARFIYRDQKKHKEALEIAKLAKTRFPDEEIWLHEVGENRLELNTASDVLKESSDGTRSFTNISADNIKELDTWVKQKNGKYYYPTLLKKMQTAPESLGYDEYFMLKYGQSAQKNYSPYGPTTSTISHWTMMNQGKYEEALKNIRKDLKNAPMNMDLLNYEAYICLEVLGDKDGFAMAMQHYNGFANSSLYTGDGKAFESAFVITYLPDERTIMHLLDLEIGTKELIQHEGHTYEVITGHRDEHLEKVYFNIDKPFTVIEKLSN